MSASSKMAKDAEEAMSESSWTALVKGKERDWRSIDLEGDMEKLEVVGPWSRTEGGSVDHQRKMGHRSVRTKIAREESDKPKEAEMKVHGECFKKRFEIQSPKRKVIRVESEETQDHVRETLAISQEEADEMGFVPSALIEARGPIYWCDNRCTEKAVRYWQIASMVVEEGGEAHTINLCQQCYNEQLVQQGKPRLNLWQWRGIVEQKAHRGRIWKVMGTEQFIRGMWAYFTLERTEVRKILAEASREKHEGIQGQWIQESPFRAVLEQVKKSADADCGPQMMRRGYLAIKNGSWEEFKERYGKGPSKEFAKLPRRWQRKSNWEEGHGLLAAGHCASRWNGRSRLVVCLPTLQQFFFGGPHLVGIDGTRRRQQQKEEALQLVVCGVWRPIRRESAQHNTGGAVRNQCPLGATKAM